MNGSAVLNEASLEELVRRSYERARQDAVLGPVFAKAITDWPPHLERITCFWSATLLGGARYRGNALAAHQRHADIDPAMFGRWLSLWAQTSSEIFPPETAEAVQRRAERIAESLQLGLFFRPSQSGENRLERE